MGQFVSGLQGPGPDFELPANIDAERVILGAILLDNARYDEVAVVLTPEDFFLDSHQRIFRRMAGLMEARHAVDIVTLSEDLGMHKEVEAIGGVAYVSSLTEGIPRRPVIGEYLRIVKDKALGRRIQTICQLAMTRAADQTETALETGMTLSSALEEALLATRPASFQTAGDYLRIEFPTPESMVAKTARMTGIESGFRDFDRMTCGFQKGELTIVAARPSMGKSSLMWNIAEHVGINCESIVAIKSLEMKRSVLLRRAICSRARVPFQDHRSGEMQGHKQQKEDFAEAYGEIVRAPIYMDDTSDSAKGIVAKARALKREKGLDLLMIDYLGLIQHDERASRYRTQHQEVGLDCLSMKWLAAELDVPVVLLCQLSRELTKRIDKRPLLSDLRDSGSIEEHADLVTFLHREGYYEPKEASLRNSAEWILAKNRNGPVGTVALRWDPEYLRLSDGNGDSSGPETTLPW